MRETRRVLLGSAVFSFALLSVGRAWAADATLYEVTENLRFIDVEGGVFVRNAQSTLMGFARVGTSLCPNEALVTNPQAQTCTVTASGHAHLVNLVGPVSGTFKVVVNVPTNSPVHVPDCPMLGGTFQGTVNLSPGLSGIPIGSLAATFTITETPGPDCKLLPIDSPPRPVPVSGTFRLPFALTPDGHAARTGRHQAAFYLSDTGQLIRVEPDERDLGFPLVRLELTLGE